ncbi:endoribonuclease L-PSP [Microdochium trichocladiopsis]|uniref:Endoribonuclease L-PSP n=1 Tax=Microdochium trichocladiopsis TaxID=1682393 RepID=A0A9P9BSE3_9PEZI|nr:endoribonuclease L-PSP [Microdochium trichocladiopsis]KAH7028751.1 endoribonuclease L-PSP [Microdochium trichocladiopsis]
MSNAQFSNYPGTECIPRDYHFSQVVRIGNTLRTSGQGGWDANSSIAPSRKAQIDLALQIVLAALRAAEPPATYKNVVSVRNYHTDLGRTFMMMPADFKELGADHRPMWTCVEVKRLALDEMAIEIEVEALV